MFEKIDNKCDEIEIRLVTVKKKISKILTRLRNWYVLDI